MAAHTFEFTAPLWLYGGKATWHFLTLPFDVTDEIDELTSEATRGFGSVRVQVTIGATTWTTSIFPDAKRESFILPVKAAVRKAESLAVDSDCRVRLQLVDFGN
ncbi:MAG: DUF1905 domain-containing protein [Actinobacteria bacterium]|nr:DUF1905 domain-containing protein [Actinomycetota bacterium]